MSDLCKHGCECRQCAAEALATLLITALALVLSLAGWRPSPAPVLARAPAPPPPALLPPVPPLERLRVAKLDRLARDAELVLKLAREADRNGFGGLLFADLPEVDATTAAGRMVLTVMASVAEYEGRRIAERTREALAAAKARGVKLGGTRLGTLRENAAAKAAAAGRSEALRPILAAMAALAAPPAWGAAVLEVLAGMGGLTRWGCARVGRTLARPVVVASGGGCPCARVGRTHGKHWGLTL